MFDFVSEVDRRHTDSAKWHEIRETMGQNSDDVLAVSVADMEFQPAPQIVEALVEAARNDIFGYDLVPDAYNQAVANWMLRRHHWQIDPQWISTADGVIPAINTALRAFTNPGDQLIIQRPVYYPFTAAADNNELEIANNALVYDEQTLQYSIDFEDLERRAAHPRCTAMLLCNPHNPVGRVWTADELRRIGDICIAHNVMLLVDEIHADFERKGHKVTMFASLGEPYASHCLVFTAPSKTFNLAGLCTSNTIIPNPELKRRYDESANRIGGMQPGHFGLVACKAAYDTAEDWLDELLDVLQHNRGTLRQFIDSQHTYRLVEPEGTYLAWLDCRALPGVTREDGTVDARALERLMRETARLFCDEGDLFGPEGAGFERINLACSPAMMHCIIQRLSALI